MAAKRASIADLAKELNVSISTVSRALNNDPNISVATRTRVVALAQERHYQPNRLAAGLRKGRSNLLGVMVPHIEGAFFAGVMHGIETAATKAGFHVMICQSNEDVHHEKQNIETLLNAQVEGILVSLSRTTHDFKHFEKVRKHGVPLVFFDRILEGTDVNAVVIDDHQAAYQVVQHLIEQGHRRIAHFAGPQHLNIYKNRRQGYLSALYTHGLPVEEELIFTCDMTLDDGVAGMQQFLGLPAATRPDAVFSASDFSALGAMQVLKEQGLRVPLDLALAGFSNELFTSYIEPSLTSVDQRCEQMGQSAVDMFLDMLEVRTDARRTRRIVLQPKVLIRDSSVRHPAA
ncbi:LacI family DNA-binding transcriptional regulator [Hymenobacter terrenus]|uniref:LacI family DNA-binding transcriptional regulator n=1 Tax=Hymenobacter terrenus TaxID=1629124 RepID=UPI000619FF31|nr:LacI family DNA-binding transcriptional regulator [Hymenobacter terrenus]